MKYTYLGEFPPPYGGVTIKNKLLFMGLSSYIEISHSCFYDDKNFVLRFISLISLLHSKNNALIIGISRYSLKKLTYALYVLNRKLMNKSIVMVMGGTFPQMVADEIYFQKILKEYKHIYVETNGMKDKLNSLNISNVSIFPNCRLRPRKNIEIDEPGSRLKFVFFSQISTDKGVDIILNAASILSQKEIDYQIDFYGHIDKRYKSQFETILRSNEKLNYLGVYKQTEQGDVYDKLKEYDVLLFPTKCTTEGVPGILVESKIAGLPAIVSDVSFNAEIIENGINGIVLAKNTSNKLSNAIEKLSLDTNLLKTMKLNAIKSSEYYFIDNHIVDIVKHIL